LDDRWRFCKFSKAFLELLEFSTEELEYIIGRTTAQVIVDLNSPFLNRINPSTHKELLEMYLPLYYSHMSYMNDDEIYQNTVKEIMIKPITKSMWDNLLKDKVQINASQESRVIHFKIDRESVSLYYSPLPLSRNSRFVLVEFHI